MATSIYTSWERERLADLEKNQDDIISRWNSDRDDELRDRYREVCGIYDLTLDTIAMAEKRLKSMKKFFSCMEIEGSPCNKMERIQKKIKECEEKLEIDQKDLKQLKKEKEESELILSGMKKIEQKTQKFVALKTELSCFDNKIKRLEYIKEENSERYIRLLQESIRLREMYMQFVEKMDEELLLDLNHSEDKLVESKASLSEIMKVLEDGE